MGKTEKAAATTAVGADALRAQLVEAWRSNNRINLLLIERIGDEGMESTLSTRGGRTVRRQFTHLHNMRVWQLEKRAKDLVAGLDKFATRDEPDRETLAAALRASGAAVERFLVDSLAGVDGRRRFKKGVFTALSYFVAHESHHRGSILLTLKQCGHHLDKATRYGIWDWDRI